MKKNTNVIYFDMVTHLIVGFILSLTLSLFTECLMFGMGITIVAGIAKEAWDVNTRTDSIYYNMFCTWIGALCAGMVYMIIAFPMF